jgi:hypothetical protein
MLNNGLGLFEIVGFPRLHYMPLLADVATETMTCTLVQDKNEIMAVM